MDTLSKQCMEMLTHPFTIFLLTVLIGLIAWILKAIMDISKVQASTTELLSHLVRNQEATSQAITDLAAELHTLKGEHNVMVQQAGHFKKKD